MKTFASFVLAITLAPFTVASAQQIRRIEEPKPLEATDPRAVKSGSIVKHILTAERESAIAALRKEADETYAKDANIEKDVDAQIKRLSAGKYRISSYEEGFGTDVVVFLTNDKGEEANLVVRFNADRKITGFAMAKIERQEVPAPAEGCSP
jgi:hypothetical protein